MNWIEDQPEWQQQQAAASAPDSTTPGASLYRRLYRLLRRLPQEPVMPGLTDAVSTRLRVEARRRWWRRLAGIVLALAATIGLMRMVVPLLLPAAAVLSTRWPALPWPLLLAAVGGLLVSVAISRWLQRRRH